MNFKRTHDFIESVDESNKKLRLMVDEIEQYKKKIKKYESQINQYEVKIGQYKSKNERQFQALVELEEQENQALVELEEHCSKVESPNDEQKTRIFGLRKQLYMKELKYNELESSVLGFERSFKTRRPDCIVSPMPAFESYLEKNVTKAPHRKKYYATIKKLVDGKGITFGNKKKNLTFLKQQRP